MSQHNKESRLGIVRRYGSLADMCGAWQSARFPPESGHSVGWVNFRLCQEELLVPVDRWKA